MEQGMQQYHQRDRLLSDLGFKSYRSYLSSDLWRTTRRRFLQTRKKCEICDRARATQVHHIRYTKRALLGHSYRDMIAICGECHCRAELDSLGYKRTWAETQNQLIKKLRT